MRIEATSKTENSEANASFFSTFNSVVQSSTNLELERLQTESYFNKNDDMGYGLAFVKRDRLVVVNFQKTDGIRHRIHPRLLAGKHFEATNQPAQALNEYLACYPLFRQLEEDEVIASAAENDLAKAIRRINFTANIDEISGSEVQKAVDKLVQRPIKSAEDVAWFIAYTLKNQNNIQNRKVMVTPFTYQDTKLGSPFSRYFKQELENQLVDLARWNIVQQSADFNPRTQDLSKEYAEANGVEFVVSGTSWRCQIR